MRLIDADVLLNKTAELEAVALEQVANYEPLSDRHPGEWHRWTGILRDRTNFKYDVMNAPTIEAEPIKHGEWRADEMSYTVGETWCSVCRTQYYIDDLYNVGENDLPNYCPHCGAKMDGGDRI